MNLTVTQDNLYLFLPSKTSRLADILAEERGIDIVEAIKSVYNSDIYRQLEIEDTKLWHLGPVALSESIM
ncbi:MAG: hypothetical protein II480_05420 [Bacteroidales bacterium]|jgi:hypothetical protein|nr:hypothetical protein [Bacteroidales bacterium]MEE3486153.1 hypothetical protein [Bacteroidales bacterium]